MKLFKINKKYNGKYLKYYVAKYINSDNKIKEYEFVSRDDLDNDFQYNTNSISIIAFNENMDSILLLKEFRMATNKYVYSFCAGLVEENETIIDAAKRELKEETNLEIIEIIDELNNAFGAIGISNEIIKTIICKVKGEIINSKDPNEEIYARWFNKEEAKQLLNDKDVYLSSRCQILIWLWTNNLK